MERRRRLPQASPPDQSTPPAPERDRTSNAERPNGLEQLRAFAAGPVPTMTAAWLAAFVLALVSAPTHALLILLGFAGAVVAGLVGVGGAVVMIPLLLFVPPLLGVGPFGIHTITGVTMIQVAAAGLAGTLGHAQHGAFRGRLVVILGGAMMAGSLVGATGSRFASAALLTALFATLAAVAAVLLLLPMRRLPREIEAADVRFDPRLAIGLGLGVGVLVGMVGAGGGFLLMPLMIFALRIPLRVAVGASLGIVTLSGLAGAVGKSLTGQVDWLMALALVTGALPGARLGAFVSRRTSTTTLRVILGLLIGAMAVQMWWDILR